MSVHIGLAFCREKINYTVFFKNDQTLILDHIGSISYPFPYNESHLFSEEIVPTIANLIKDNILSNQSENVNLYISIESNLAMIKRIALPDNFSKEGEIEHIGWDLSQSLIEPLEQFVFYKTDNCFESENQKDYLTIAIQKRIIDFFSKLSEETGLNLVDISVNQLVAEITLRNTIHNQVDGLVALFKLGTSRLESTFLWNGDYYNSHYDRIIQDSNMDSYDEKLLDKIKSKIKQMENLFAQFTQEQVKVSRVFIYGENIADEFIQRLQNNMSVIPFRLNPLQNVEKSEKLQNTLPSIEEATQHVESIGVVLDQ